CRSLLSLHFPDKTYDDLRTVRMDKYPPWDLHIRNSGYSAHGTYIRTCFSAARKRAETDPAALPLCLYHARQCAHTDESNILHIPLASKTDTDFFLPLHRQAVD